MYFNPILSVKLSRSTLKIFSLTSWSNLSSCFCVLSVASFWFLHSHSSSPFIDKRWIISHFPSAQSESPYGGLRGFTSSAPLQLLLPYVLPLSPLLFNLTFLVFLLFFEHTRHAPMSSFVLLFCLEPSSLNICLGLLLISFLCLLSLDFLCPPSYKCIPVCQCSMCSCHFLLAFITIW